MELNLQTALCGTGMIVLRQNQEPRIVSNPIINSLIRYKLLFYCCLGHPTIMFRAGRVANLVQYDESAELMEDYDLWLRLANLNEKEEKFRFANIGQALVGIRKHLEN